MLWDGFWGYFWAQNTTTNFCFSPGLVTGFCSLYVWMHGDKCPSAVWSPRGTAWNSDPRTCASRSVILIIFQATPAVKVWPPCSNLWSARSQVSAALFYVQTVCSCGHKPVQTIAGFSPASKGLAMLSQSKHWSGGHGVCRTYSAAL